MNNEIAIEKDLNETDNLRRALSGVSSLPGVYLMKDVDDQVLYVGKARNLKKRLASYFVSLERLSLKTAALVRNIKQFDTIVTSTEKEALILESNLIKRFRPKYNIILKDDKRYPSMRLDIREDFPHLEIVRKIQKDGALYFGPYSSAHAVRQTLKFIHKTFKLRKCCTSVLLAKRRSCLNYQMGTCLGPCHHHVEKETYAEVVKEVVLFLRGRTPDLIKDLKAQMHIAANCQEFEKAAVLRDKIFALQSTLEHQVSVITDFKDRDVIALSTSSNLTVVTILFIRGGFLLDHSHFSFTDTMVPEEELISAFIQQYYEKGHYLPKEILVSTLPEEADLIAERLQELKGEKVQLLQPKRGEKLKLLNMALENAKKELGNEFNRAASEIALLERLRQRLRLQNIPSRIECIDNSNLSGTEAVSAIVVFEKGKPLKSGYRKFKIRDVSQPDDYGYMYEVLKRRFSKNHDDMPLPDLLMVDGGKGQLSIAVSVLKELNLYNQFDLLAIAKKDEEKGESEDKIYKPERLNPIVFGKDRDLLLFLQRVRDEAHRFVITFHRNRRSRRILQSVLDDITGIGPKRKKRLLSHFGSIESIQAASDDQIAALPGMNHKIAATVRAYLKNRPL